MNTDCVFCKIVAGTLPSVRVYEDDEVLAFLDIGPIIKGHTLVIPKKHYDPLIATPADLLQKLIVVVQKVARAQVENLRADGVNIAQANGQVAGQVVPHLHFHVIPRFQQDGYSFHWKAGRYDDPAELETLGRRLRGAIG